MVKTALELGSNYDNGELPAIDKEKSPLCFAVRFDQKPKISGTKLAIQPSDARIWTTPFSAIQGFQREIDKGHSILQVRRDGVPNSTKTTYNVLNAMQIDDEEWNSLLPSLSKDDLAKLQKEETWDGISEEELQKLENLGVKKE